MWGAEAAFLAEAAIAFVMMTTILNVSSAPRWSRFTGLAAGLLVATYITVESPVSGMSLNPARTLGANLLADAARSLWIYFIAPPLGMLLAAELHLLLERGDYVPRERDNWDSRAVNVAAKYNTTETWRDKNGKPLHPHTNYYVGGNTKFYGAALFRLREQDFGALVHSSSRAASIRRRRAAPRSAPRPDSRRQTAPATHPRRRP